MSGRNHNFNPDKNPFRASGGGGGGGGRGSGGRGGGRGRGGGGGGRGSFNRPASGTTTAGTTPAVKATLKGKTFDNPFDKFANAKKKHEVVNRRVKGEDRNVGRALSKSTEERKKRLLAEISASKKSNTFADKYVFLNIILVCKSTNHCCCRCIGGSVKLMLTCR
jgi:hypothetical protein